MIVPDRILLVLPLVVPMATAVLALFVRRWRSAQRVVCVAGAVALPVANGYLAWRVWTEGVLATQMGDWIAPFGITVVVDLLSAALLVVTGLAGAAAVLYALADVDAERERFGYFPLMFFLLMGVDGAFITGDLFNLYVWFEVLLMASFVLLVLGNRPEQLQGGVKYLIVNLVSSTAFLASIGLLYGLTGALNFADLHGRIDAVQAAGLETVLALLFLVAFGIKAALFPLFFWLPASYHTPPAPVAALFAGLLTKVGVYALLRTFTLLFDAPTVYTQTVLLWVAGTTMVAGALGALVQRDLQRLFAFLVVSAMGYVVMGLALFSETGFSGAVFYTVQDVLVKVLLFLLVGSMIVATGTRRLDESGGLYRARPLLAFMYVVPAFALAGFPPFTGFWAKLVLVRAGVAAEQYALVAAALVAGVVTLIVVGQVWSRVFWRPAAGLRPTPSSSPAERWRYVPAVLLTVVLLALALYPQPLVLYAERTAALLLNPQPYVEAVLGTAP